MEGTLKYEYDEDDEVQMGTVPELAEKQTNGGSGQLEHMPAPRTVSPGSSSEGEGATGAALEFRTIPQSSDERATGSTTDPTSAGVEELDADVDLEYDSDHSSLQEDEL